MKSHNALAVALMIAVAPAPLLAQGRPLTPAQAAAAVAEVTRPPEDKARDADRKPAEMLLFAGIRPGMTVVDLLPGGGYFTRLFSNAVGPTGKVIAYVPDESLARNPKALDKINAIAAEPAHANVVPSHNPLMAEGPENVADVVWTSQNYHDLHNAPNADLVGFNKLVLRSLKPGGIYIVLDHVAPAGSGFTSTRELHRIDPVAVKAEVLAAGFVFDGESKVLANPADPHTVGVRDGQVQGHTDQFILRFRKPGGQRR